MPELTDMELMKQLRQNQILPVYFFYGKELFLLEKALHALIKKIVPPGMESFNLQKFDGEKISVEEIENASEALPVMAQRKCVWVNNWNVDKLSADQTNRLKDLLKNPSPTTVLVFTVTAFEVNLKKSSKYKTFVTAVNKVGAAIEFGLKDRSALTKALCDRAEKLGSSLSPKNAGLLIDRCGQSLTVLYHELDKLCDYAGEAEITPEQINQSVTPTLDSSAFDLCRAVLRGQGDQALGLLDELFFQRVEPVAILGALTMSFVDLYRAKAASAQGVKSPQIVSDFSYPKNLEFRVRNALSDSARMPASRLRRCIQLLMDADQTLKSSSCDPKILLEELVVSMLAAR